MRTDAVAPVIAVMLILAIAVTFYSAWNALVIPSMKQTAEVEHLRNVESAFRHFSSDITYAASSHQNHLSFSEPVQLGGGDVMFDTLRSGGSLSIRNNPAPIYSLTLYDANGLALHERNGSLVNISYEPLNNFWQDQGYRWQNGYINITKHRTLQTPLDYYNMTDVNDDMTSSGGILAAFARSFVEADYTANSTTPGDCSGLTLVAVNITASPNHQFISSNGFGTLKLVSNVETASYRGVSGVSIGSGSDPLEKQILTGWNSTFSSIANTCPENIWYVPENSGEDLSFYSLEQNVSPVDVTLKVVTIEIGAY